MMPPFQVWSLIHGFTLLCLAGEFGPPRQALETGVFDQVIALLEHLGPPDPALRS